jgi:hypothetical protein
MSQMLHNDRASGMPSCKLECPRNNMRKINNLTEE